MPEVHEDAPEVLVVLLDAVVEGTDVLLVEEAEDALFELAAAFAGDDFDQSDALFDGFVDDALKLGLDFVAFVVDVVQVEFELCHGDTYSGSAGMPHSRRLPSPLPEMSMYPSDVNLRTETGCV